MPLTATAQAVIPKPVRMAAKPGAFVLTPQTAIWTERASASVGHQLARYLDRATGLTLRVVTGGPVPPRSIALRRDPALKRLGAEGYVLDVSARAVVARAPERILDVNFRPLDTRQPCCS